MDSREFVETRTKRCMAQTLEDVERLIEQPLSRLIASDEPITAARLVEIVRDIDEVKRIYRKKIQALASDCLDLVPSELQINGYEPLVRR